MGKSHGLKRRGDFYHKQLSETRTASEKEALQLAQDPAYRRFRKNNPLPIAQEVVEVADEQTTAQEGL